MPPIPVHIDDPITPKKASAITPQTAGENSPPGYNGSNATPTNAGGGGEIQSPSYPPARPGAAAVPAPTPYIPAPPTRTQPTQGANSINGPPPPQPGAVPAPTSATATSLNGLPPPPKAGESTQQQQQQQSTTSIPAPSQMRIPPPSLNQAPTHSTTTANAYQPPANPLGPATLTLGAVPMGQSAQEPSSLHPSGYQQNLFAQEMSPAQRASLDMQVADERARGRSGSLGGLLGGGGDGGGSAGGGFGAGAGGPGEGVWNAVKGWAATAGSKAAEMEKEAWKRINGE